MASGDVSVRGRWLNRGACYRDTVESGGTAISERSMNSGACCWAPVAAGGVSIRRQQLNSYARCGDRQRWMSSVLQDLGVGAVSLETAEPGESVNRDPQERCGPYTIQAIM
jgi:hypothetical protein